jgi:hypothetical protein
MMNRWLDKRLLDRIPPRYPASGLLNGSKLPSSSIHVEGSIVRSGVHHA